MPDIKKNDFKSSLFLFNFLYNGAKRLRIELKSENFEKQMWVVLKQGGFLCATELYICSNLNLKFKLLKKYIMCALCNYEL